MADKPLDEMSKAELRTELADSRKTSKILARVIFLGYLAVVVYIWRAEIISFLKRSWAEDPR